MGRFEFLVALADASRYMHLMGPLSTVLQAVDIDYVKAMNEVKLLINLLRGTSN